MEILRIALSALSSAASLFIFSKLMGRKQISQLNLFDYITGITIGSIAAEMALNPDELVLSFTAMAVFAILAWGISVLTNISHALRCFFTGKPKILYDNGVLSRKELKKAHMDLNDFFTLLRLSGFFDLREAETILLEHNGRLTVLPKSGVRPLTASDLKLPVVQQRIPINLIQDGKVMKENLCLIGKDEKWLKEELRLQNCASESEVFLASLDSEGILNIWKMT